MAAIMVSRLRGAALFATSRLVSPLSSSTGFNSGTYPGRKCCSMRSASSASQVLTALALWVGYWSAIRWMRDSE